MSSAAAGTTSSTTTSTTASTSGSTSRVRSSSCPSGSSSSSSSMRGHSPSSLSGSPAGSGKNKRRNLAARERSRSFLSLRIKPDMQLDSYWRGEDLEYCNNSNNFLFPGKDSFSEESDEMTSPPLLVYPRNRTASCHRAEESSCWVPPQVLSNCSSNGHRTRTKRLRKLGIGATSNVFLAMELHSLQLLAVKEVHLRGGHQAGGCHIGAVRNEVNALKHQQEQQGGTGEESPIFGGRSSCPHIVAYYGSAELHDQSVAFIATEYCGGGTCQDWIDQGIAAPEPWLAHIAHQCLEALNAVHGWGLLHHDIKPANVLLTQDGDAKLADFGLSTHPSHDGEDSGGMQGGTLRFMSPERLRGQQSCTPLSDVWSLGLTLASVAMGRVPGKNTLSPFTQLMEAEQLVHTVSQMDGFSPILQDFLSLFLQPALDGRSSVKKLLHHPFLEQRYNWKRLCPDVLHAIQERNPPRLASLESDILEEIKLIGTLRRDSFYEERVEALARELGTSSDELRERLVIDGTPPTSSTQCTRFGGGGGRLSNDFPEWSDCETSTECEEEEDDDELSCSNKFQLPSPSPPSPSFSTGERNV
jgi:serine/threonine protein kinase